MDDTHRRFPIGPYAPPTAPLDAPARAACIDAIARTPSAMRTLVDGLSGVDLERRYRAGGWTIRQVVHHVADSHMHAYVRFKFALSEEAPHVRAYDEKRWAEFPDVGDVPVEASLDLIDALHGRWVSTLRALSGEDFLRTYIHSELGTVFLYAALGQYAWHGRHHTAHIQLALA